MAGSGTGRAWILALTFFGVALAGCTGGDSTPAADLKEATAPEFDDDTGAVEGRALNEEGLPVSGAQVAILALELETVTQADGTFVLNNIAPGKYPLFVQRLGYEAAQRSVTVVAGEATQVEFVLTSIAVAEPYQDTFGPFNGYFECKMSMSNFVLNSWTDNCGSVCALQCVWAPPLGSNEKNGFEFEMTSDDYRTFVGEMRWTQSSSATSTELRMSFSHNERSSSHWFCSGEGPSVLSWRFERTTADEEAECFGASRGGSDDPLEPSTDNVLLIYAGVPFSRTSTSNPTGPPSFITFQQNFEMQVTAFYGEVAPEGFAGLSDA